MNESDLINYFITKLGGKVRTEIGGPRSGKYAKIKHSHIDGLGSKI